jgi:hypothetical protein
LAAVATLLSFPHKRRRRGNPNFRKPLLLFPPAPALATEFELQVRHLNLTPEMYGESRELRAWCMRNRNRVYVPESLLQEWGLTVDAIFGATA